MRFLCVYKSTKDPSTPPSPEAEVAMAELIGAMTTAGVLLATELCMDSAHGAVVVAEQLPGRAPDEAGGQAGLGAVAGACRTPVGCASWT